MTDSPENRHSLTYAQLAAEARAERGGEGGYDVRASPTIAYLLWFFLGWLGVHRLYLRRGRSALLMIVLAAAGMALEVSGEGLWLTIPLGIWVLYDGTQIPNWVAEINERRF